jgi:hypothetical protein
MLPPPIVRKESRFPCEAADRNMQALPRNFFFEDKVGRNVSADVRGIQAALRDVHGATALADELVAGARWSHGKEHPSVDSTVSDRIPDAPNQNS